MDIINVSQDNFQEWVDLALQLWPHSSIAEMQAILQSPRQAGFLVRGEEGSAIGFINLSLRYEYVPDASQSPVAFVEGIYVKAAYRQQGVGAALMQYAEQWARAQGCIELASDALLENTASHAFHTKVGFREVERVVFFIKPIALAN